MAQEIIRVRVDPYARKMIQIAEIVTVLRGTYVIWKLENVDEFVEAQLLTELAFTLYFQKESPLEWRNQDLLLTSSNLSNFQNGQQLAAGYASERGEFKYGIRVSKPFGRIIYDEDPYLIVN